MTIHVDTNGNTFTVGAEVIIHSGFENFGERYSKIAKVYKNGNFILEGDVNKKQWKPSGSGQYLHASPVKAGYSRFTPHVTLKSEEELEKIREKKEARARQDRFAIIQQKIANFNRHRRFSEEVLQALEAAVAKAETGE